MYRNIFYMDKLLMPKKTEKAPLMHLKSYIAASGNMRIILAKYYAFFTTAKRLVIPMK